MNNIPPQALEQLHSVASEINRALFKTWLNDYARQVKSLSAFQKRFVEEIERGNQTERQLSEIMRLLQAQQRDCLQWAGYLENLSSECISEEALKTWRAEFSAVLQTLPENLDIEITPASYAPREGDDFRRRVWKANKRIELKRQDLALSIRNTLRRLLGKARKEHPQQIRKLALRDFLEFYIVLPFVGQFIINAQRTLQYVARFYSDVITNLTEAADRFLYLETFEQACTGLYGDDLKTILLEFKEAIPDSSHIREEIKSFQQELEDDFDAFTTSLRTAAALHAEAASGTWLLPSRKYARDKIAEGYDRLKNRMARGAERWQALFTGERETWRKDIELTCLQAELTCIYSETIDAIRQRIDEEIVPGFEEPETMIEAALQRFDADVKEESELEQDILAESRSMLRKLSREKLPHIIETILQSQIQSRFDSFLSRARHAVDQLPELNQVYRHKDLEVIPPETSLVDIPIKNLVMEEIYPAIEERHREFSDGIEAELARMTRDVSEIDDIIEFNLDSALELLQTGEDEAAAQEAQTIVIEGLQRTQTQLNIQLERNRDLLELTRKSLIDITRQFELEIQALADNERIIDLQLRAAAARTQEEIRNYRRQLLQRVKKGLPAILETARRLASRLRSEYLRLRRITGMEHDTAVIEGRLNDFLSRTQTQLKSQPYVYRRLFRFEPLTDERFFSGRANDFQQLKEKFELWKSGQFAGTALIGEKGSGRTTLLNLARKDIFKTYRIYLLELNKTVHSEQGLCEQLRTTFDLEETTGLEALEQNILRIEQPCVCILENLHKLFLRTVDGFDAIERFLLLMTRTHTRIYWVVTCGIYGWNYIDRVLDLSRFFRYKIYLSELSSENIKEIILKRHRVSGYQLAFETPEKFAQTRKFKKLSSDDARQQYLREYYFDQLNKVAAGNVTVAILFWLCAIRKFDKDKITVDPAIDFETGFLQNLPAEDLFFFAALLQHESLTVEQHASIFGQSVQESLLSIQRMRNFGFLVETSNGYQLHYLLYRPIVRALKNKNILH